MRLFFHFADIILKQSIAGGVRTIALQRWSNLFLWCCIKIPPEQFLHFDAPQYRHQRQV
ncbi:hypothetical protein RchiOBHm_Chr6g0267201 [Rosa chinensis]|uniref:Uncharacterized protein n=1 Tax=Rosa chinensis TaxID=74649 RepID=A0A2P6PPZ2_ROSCH|nr:hypothetical protein RchiOBHm_Chr6g0267201 [Rosa chinensis]